MRGNFFCVVILSLLPLMARAQGETRLGIKAGVTSANINGPDVNQLSNNGSASSLQGLHFGLFINSKIKKHFWIKSEILTIQKGSVLHMKGQSGVQFQSKFKSQYVDVYPISPTFHWKGFQALAGPYISMLLTSSAQDSVGNANSNFGSQNSLSSYRQKIDAGFVIGLEYEYAKLGISIGARYTKGFVPLFENAGAIVTGPTSPPLPAQKIYNESLSLSIGYTFGSKKNP